LASCPADEPDGIESMSPKTLLPTASTARETLSSTGGSSEVRNVIVSSIS